MNVTFRDATLFVFKITFSEPRYADYVYLTFFFLISAFHYIPPPANGAS